MRRFLIVVAALFVLLLDGNLPTPLYAVYRERFGFSGTELTLIFATYTVAAAVRAVGRVIALAAAFTALWHVAARGDTVAA